jgi:hypothetical protein
MAEKKKRNDGMRSMAIIGWLMFTYGAVMLILLFTPARQWALEHSIAALVSGSDRRANNSVQGPVDEPMAYAGSVVLMIAGLWFALLVPTVIRRSQAKQLAAFDDQNPPNPQP